MMPLIPAAARRRVLLVVLAWVLVAAADAGACTVLALAISHHALPGGVLLAAGCALIITVLVARAGYLTGVRLAGDLYGELVRTFTRARLAWFSQENRSRLATVAGHAIPGLMGVPAHQLQTLILAPLVPIFTVFGIALVNGVTAALLIAGLLALALLIQLSAQRALARADSGREACELASAEASLELVDHLDLLRTAAGPERAVSRLLGTWDAQEAALRRTNRAAPPAIMLSGLASALPLAGALLWIASRQPVDPTWAVAFIILTTRAGAPVAELALSGVTINAIRSMIGQYQGVVQVPSLPEPLESATVDRADLEVRDVSRGPVISGLSARIPAGTTVILRGPTGSGKSTALGLLMRFEDPDSGAITLGGVDLRELQYEELARHLAYVPQDAIVFEGTLAENIRLGDPEADDAAVLDAAHRAQLQAVISGHPDGIHQMVGHRGCLLSGGERQRVAIAGALLKNAPILVLDEATSALDAETESAIAGEIRGLTSTRIIVTHGEATRTWAPDLHIDLG